MTDEDITPDVCPSLRRDPWVTPDEWHITDDMLEELRRAVTVRSQVS